MDVQDITGTSKIGKICGKIDGDKTINVNWHKAKVVFHSDAVAQGKGFQASYKAIHVLPGNKRMGRDYCLIRKFSVMLGWEFFLSRSID